MFGTELTLVGGSEYHLGTQCLEQHSSLHRHGRGHGQDQLIALRRSHHRKADTYDVMVMSLEHQ